jgi:hypothetical protein
VAAQSFQTSAPGAEVVGQTEMSSVGVPPKAELEFQSRPGPGRHQSTFGASTACRAQSCLLRKIAAPPTHGRESGCWLRLAISTEISPQYSR